MFAALTFDRDPLSQSGDTLLIQLTHWVQTVGGYAAFGLVVALLALRGSRQFDKELSNIGKLVLACTGLSLAAFVFAFVVWFPELRDWWRSDAGSPAPAAGWRGKFQMIARTAAGAIAILGVLVPMLSDLARLSARRIGAIARLSFKEAVRSRVLLAFAALLLVVMFGSWFLPSKYEDEVRTYVQVVFAAMALLLVLASLLVASFGIPNDIRNQTIHTVLTKPVQRFEIFLGRFLGYATLMTLVLLVITTFGATYVVRGISREAEEESLKARVPVWGTLTFGGIDGQKARQKGENVGREWDYRSYIRSPQRGDKDRQYAVWTFADLPRALADRDKVRVEFTFDIYRTTKGREGQGVLATFMMESGKYDKAAFDKRRGELAEKSRTDADMQAKLSADPTHIDKLLLEEFGYYEVRSVEVKDYHTQFVEFPGAVLKAATGAGKDNAPLKIRVQCDSPTQFLGMAKYDLYVREDVDKGVDKLGFVANFYKGAFGVWLRLCLVIGLAVALSTYLNSVITLVVTLVLFGFGLVQAFITEVAGRQNVGGGPLEAFYRLTKKPGGESIAIPLEETASVRVATWGDKAFSWSLQRFLDVIPDVDRFSFTEWVAEGVSLAPADMGKAFVYLVGYLVPWSVAAYYLLRWREVASST